jgi:hypothetical protein
MEGSAVSRVPAGSLDDMTRRWARWALLGAGVTFAILSIAMALRYDWATGIWPWDDARMTYIFFGSIGMATAAPLIWIALANEPGALEPLALELCVAMFATFGFMVYRWTRHNESDLLGVVIGSFVVAIAFVGIYRWSRRQPLRDQRRIPLYVIVSFAIFLAVLVPVGIALVFQVDDVFPWTLRPPTSTVIGMIFLGAALLFAWILAHPMWAYAGPALAAFLAYDLVLYVPYVDLLRDRDATRSIYGPRGEEVNERSLAVYLTVLGFSTLVAVYALFIDRRTRVWGTGRG